jgi:hypothetical protein
MNGDKLFMSTRNMQNMIKMKRSDMRGQNRSTNMNNIHTCSIGRPDLIIAIISFMHSELLKFTQYVISCARVKVPVGVSTIGRSRHGNKAIVGDGFFIKPIPTYVGGVDRLHANLVEWFR